jgi:hypothetical protein
MINKDKSTLKLVNLWYCVSRQIFVCKSSLHCMYTLVCNVRLVPTVDGWSLYRSNYNINMDNRTQNKDRCCEVVVTTGLTLA